MSSAVKRIACALPATLKSLCESGCIVRDPAFRHLACTRAPKTDCAAPCSPNLCECAPKPKMDAPGKALARHTYYHEVYML